MSIGELLSKRSAIVAEISKLQLELDSIDRQIATLSNGTAVNFVKITNMTKIKSETILTRSFGEMNSVTVEGNVAFIVETDGGSFAFDISSNGDMSDTVRYDYLEFSYTYPQMCLWCEFLLFSKFVKYVSNFGIGAYLAIHIVKEIILTFESIDEEKKNVLVSMINDGNYFDAPYSFTFQDDEDILILKFVAENPGGIGEFEDAEFHFAKKAEGTYDFLQD